MNGIDTIIHKSSFLQTPDQNNKKVTYLDKGEIHTPPKRIDNHVGSKLTDLLILKINLKKSFLNIIKNYFNIFNHSNYYYIVLKT